MPYRTDGHRSPRASSTHLLRHSMRRPRVPAIPHERDPPPLFFRQSQKEDRMAQSGWMKRWVFAALCAVAHAKEGDRADPASKAQAIGQVEVRRVNPKLKNALVHPFQTSWVPPAADSTSKELLSVMLNDPAVVFTYGLSPSSREAVQVLQSTGCGFTEGSLFESNLFFGEFARARSPFVPY